MIRAFTILLSGVLTTGTCLAGPHEYQVPPAQTMSDAQAHASDSPLVGPGIVNVAYVVHSNEEASALKSQIDGLSLSVAGTRHYVVTSLDEIARRIDGVSPVDAAMPEAGHGLALVFGHDGKLLAQSTFDLASRAMGEAMVRLIENATTSNVLDEYNLPKGERLAIKGYDPVEYIVNDRARRGSARIVSSFRGVNYRFVSKDNQSRFAADPWRYLPAYGGWCASAMGYAGRKVEIDPTNFKVKDGRLFLFYKSLIADALKDWNQHESEWEPAADNSWKQISNEDPVKPSEVDGSSRPSERQPQR